MRTGLLLFVFISAIADAKTQAVGVDCCLDEDPIYYQIQMGKLKAAEAHFEAEKQIKEIHRMLDEIRKYGMEIQERANERYSDDVERGFVEGRLSAAGQLMTVAEEYVRDLEKTNYIDYDLIGTTYRELKEILSDIRLLAKE
ncbi:MAG: hypothetical protein N2578_05670 [Bdellovibrionaceae bacterium]|nr:hypothetical protein [Pseudobdellovibrionaceae bacterium]